jgi:hypothetical protein
VQTLPLVAQLAWMLSGDDTEECSCFEQAEKQAEEA